MTQHTTPDTVENRQAQRIFSSPVALAFVRLRVSRGDTEAHARQVYLDFINEQHAQPSDRPAASGYAMT